MTAPEQPEVNKVVSAKSRPRIRIWLLINASVLIIALAASIIVLSQKAAPAPARTSAVATPEVSSFLAFQTGQTDQYVTVAATGAASKIPPGDTLWLVYRPLTGPYFPATPVSIGQSGGDFATGMAIYNFGVPINGSILYAVLCNESANLIFQQFIHVGPSVPVVLPNAGISVLPSGAVILAVTQIQP